MQRRFLSSLFRASFASAKAQQGGVLSKLAVFSSNKYDVEHLGKMNAKVDKKNQILFDYHPEELNSKTATFAEGSDAVCAFVNDKLDAECLSALKDVGVDLIALRCAGFNNVDLVKAKDLGIKVVRVPAYSPYAVAEHAMALVLSLNRKIHKAYNRTREGNFALEGLKGFDLNGRTAGIIGTGKIGSVFAHICQGFNMKVIYHDITPCEEMDKRGAKKVGLDDIYSQSDIISLHCPLNPQTKYLINKDSIEKMKPTVLIVNTGRGALLKSSDVIEALKHKRIGGLGIDVYEQEEHFFFRDCSGEIMEDDELARLLTFPNAVVTGHQAFFTEEALNNISSTTINNIIEYRTTGKCQNEVKIN